MNAKDRIRDIIDAGAADFCALSDRVWDLAEVRFALPRSADLLIEAAEKEGFRVRRGVAGMDDAFVAEWGKGSPRIGVLAEYDALANMNQEAGCGTKKAVAAGAPGHACGHNLIGTGAFAGAVGIKRYMEESGLNGAVVLFGCPAEESGYGKSFMARDGVFDDIDAALTWHPMENNAVWSASTLAVFLSYFRFRGTAAHAAAAPHLGRSALDAAELMNIGVQFLREHVIDSARIHYSFTDTGGPDNIVQPTAELHYTVRAPSLGQLREIYDRVVKVARGAAMMTDTELEIVFDAACCDYIPNRALSVAMNENFRALLPIVIPADDEALVRQLSDSQDATAKKAAPARIRKAHPDWTAEQIKEAVARPFRGDLDDIDFNDLLTASTDVGDVSWVTPTAQIMLACEPQGTPPHSWQWVANGKSALAHQGLLTAGKAIAMTAFDILNDPDLLAKAKAEHNAAHGKEPFVSPIPPEIKPK